MRGPLYLPSGVVLLKQAEGSMPPFPFGFRGVIIFAVVAVLCAVALGIFLYRGGPPQPPHPPPTPKD